jgi:hypothetical protein
VTTLVLYPREDRGTPRPATLAPRPGAPAVAVPSARTGAS